MSHRSSRYASELSDKTWELLQPSLPLKQDGPGRPLELDMREVVNAILYVVRTGCQWENLPNDYPNHNSVYYHYRKWCCDGTWQQVNTVLRQMERKERGRKQDPSAGVIDSQSVKTTEAGGAQGGSPRLRCGQERQGMQASYCG